MKSRRDRNAYAKINVPNDIGTKHSLALFPLVSFRSILMTIAVCLLTACGGGVGTSSDDEETDSVDIGVAYIKRELLTVEDEDNEGMFIPAEQDIRLPSAFHPGAHLYYRRTASAGSDEVNVTARLFPGQDIDVKDLEVSPDGSTLLFALRAPADPSAGDDNQPTWNVWEYDIATDTVTRVIDDDTTAEAGHDVAPNYLGDGRIVFSSSRQLESQAARVNAVPNGPYTPALLEQRNDENDAFGNELLISEEIMFNLHLLSEDRTTVSQLTYNFSHDLDPVVIDDGSVVFSRWHNFDGANNRGIHLYKIQPDGTGLSLVYGSRSHDTGSTPLVEDVQFSNARVQRDGRLLVMVREFSSATMAGSFELIDIENYIDHDRTINGTSGDGQQQIFAGVRTDDQMTQAGLFSAVYPLWDGSGRILASWAICEEVVGGNIRPCDNATRFNPVLTEVGLKFGIWMFDPNEGTQRPVLPPETDLIYSDLVAITNRVAPDVGTLGERDPDSGSDRMSVLHIRSVYDEDGIGADTILSARNPLSAGYADRRARFIRFSKAVPRVDEDEFPFQDFPGDNLPMIEMLGTAQIEPDGSVKLQIPSDVPYTFEILNARGESVTQPHEVWLQHREGEVVECVGCHDPDSDEPHGRIGVGPESANPGAPFTGVSTSIVAQAGDSMAEALWRDRVDARADDSRVQLPRIAAGLHYIDHWSGDSSADFNFSYADVYGGAVLPGTGPTSSSCEDEISAECRIVFNYITHIDPLWSVSRPIFDSDDIEIDNKQCVACHTIHDPLVDNARQVPAGQLNLFYDPIYQDQLPYNELTRGDNAQELDAMTGQLVDIQQFVGYQVDEFGEFVLVDDPDGTCALDEFGEIIYQRDEDGEILLDDDNNPICEILQVRVELTEPVPVAAPMLRGNALATNASGRFFAVMTNVDNLTEDHSGFMSDAELQVIRDWLDIGGQYYNSILDAVDSD